MTTPDPSATASTTIKLPVQATADIIATTMATTTEAPATPTGCVMRNGATVANGWAGNDIGDNWCNTCTCNDGVLACTQIFCITRTEPVFDTCVLPDGELVEDGW